MYLKFNILYFRIYYKLYNNSDVAFLIYIITIKRGNNSYDIILRINFKY